MQPTQSEGKDVRASNNNLTGFGFMSDLLGMWHKFFLPITKQHSKARAEQMQTTFETQVKTAS